MGDLGRKGWSSLAGANYGNESYGVSNSETGYQRSDSKEKNVSSNEEWDWIQNTSSSKTEESIE